MTQQATEELVHGSRVGKAPIALPKGVTVTVANNIVTVKGPNGTLTQEIRHAINVAVDAEHVTLTLGRNDHDLAKFHGLYRALINNMVLGVTTGYSKTLEFVGVGYRGVLSGKGLEMMLGFSHPVILPIPAGLKVVLIDQKGTGITISGADKQAVGQFAAVVRQLRKPEPYKGKGVKYQGEVVRRKAGKSSSK